MHPLHTAVELFRQYLRFSLHVDIKRGAESCGQPKGLPVRCASLLGRMPGGTCSIAIRGESAESTDSAMRSSSDAVAMSMTVLSKCLLLDGNFRSSFGSSVVASPGISPTYLCQKVAVRRRTLARFPNVHKQHAAQQYSRTLEAHILGWDTHDCWRCLKRSTMKGCCSSSKAMQA